MRKQLLILVFILACFFQSAAQRVADFGFASGVVNYVGDLGNERYFPITSASPGYQLTIRNFINDPSKTGKMYRSLSAELRLSWHRLQYDETQPIGSNKGMQLRNYMRGLSFRNDLLGASVHVTYTFYKNKYIPLYKQKVCYFLLAGIGVYHGVPEADLFKGSPDLASRYYFWLDGTIRDAEENPNGTGNVIKKDGVYETNLRDWMTEGQGYNTEIHRKKPYSYTNIGFPLGLGMRYGMNKKITFSAEFDFYYFLTDYLDDVSGRYATYEELKASFPDPEKFELAKYISDPTGRGTNGFIGAITSIRGNPKKNDSYTFLSVEVAYKLLLKKKGIWTNLSLK
ncbi:MAG: hypothetical protein NT126_02800 [Bacteroidetes bacterium]|nr:hypothetical protein [Bacteroidota bacterium]